MGGSKAISNQKASPVTIGPIIKITKTAGPSPLSEALKSRPQCVQHGATVSNPSNNGPVPHRGHRHRIPAENGEIGG